MVVVAAGGRREGVDLREVGGGQALFWCRPVSNITKKNNRKPTSYCERARAKKNEETIGGIP